MVDRVPNNSDGGIRVPIRLVTQVRDQIQDHAATNELFEGLELTDDQIAKAIVDVVDDWNYTPPPLTVVSPTDLLAIATNGAIRVAVIRGASARCLRVIAMRHAKNDMPFTAGNTTIQAHAIWRNILQLAETLTAEYESSKTRIKVGLNILGAFTQAPSELDRYYGYGYGTGLNGGAYILV
jgi:hypothetical protein